MPAHLFVARDPLVLDEAAASCIPPGVECSRFHASELDVDTIFGQLGSADLFASERCFHYVDIIDLKPTKRDSARIAEMLERLPAETTLVCTQLFDDPDRRGDEERRLKTQAFTLWKDHAKFTDLRRQSDTDNAVRWLVARAAERYSIRVSPKQAARLLYLSADRLALADAELAKLALALEADGGNVSDELLEQTVQGSPAAKFYELADSVLGCSPAADRLLLEWYRSSPETYRLINELKRRFSGMRKLRMGEKVFPPFFAHSLEKFQRRYSPQRFSAGVELLANLEQDLKGGMYAGASSKDAELTALQVFVADLRRLAG